MATNPVVLNLPSDAIDELIELARGASNLSSLMAVAGSLKPSVGVSPLSKRMAAKLGMSSSQTYTLTAALLNFYRTSVRLNASVTATADAVAANIARSVKGEQGESYLKDWDAAKGQIVAAAEQLSPDHPLAASSKAYRVATSRQYELVDLRIFADVRPVFNEAADAITQTVISYVLSIDYHDCHDHKIIQFTMDAKDVAELKSACERAERKAAVIKKDLRGQSWATTVYREPDEAEAPDAGTEQ